MLCLKRHKTSTYQITEQLYMNLYEVDDQTVYLHFTDETGNVICYDPDIQVIYNYCSMTPLCSINIYKLMIDGNYTILYKDTRTTIETVHACNIVTTTITDNENDSEDDESDAPPRSPRSPPPSPPTLRWLPRSSHEKRTRQAKCVKRRSNGKL